MVGARGLEEALPEELSHLHALAQLLPALFKLALRRMLLVRRIAMQDAG